MKQHDPIKLGPTDRVDLASITKHPGMVVLVEKILAAHVKQQLEMVHDVQPDDPNRITKIDGICAVANGMKLTLELVRRELDFNWRTLQEQEVARDRAVKNATEKTQ